MMRKGIVPDDLIEVIDDNDVHANITGGVAEWRYGGPNDAIVYALTAEQTGFRWGKLAPLGRSRD